MYVTQNIPFGMFGVLLRVETATFLRDCGGLFFFHFLYLLILTLPADRLSIWAPVLVTVT